MHEVSNHPEEEGSPSRGRPTDGSKEGADL